MPLSTVTITGTWVTAANTPATGSVTITPIREATGSGVLVPAIPTTLTLASGTINQAFVSDASTPTLYYRVTERITGAPSVTYMIVPAGSTLDLSSVTRLPDIGAGAIPNPNWPPLSLTCDFTQGPPFTPGINQMSLQASSRRNALRQVATGRGRQYELNQVQAGTLTATITDPLEYLDPVNSASPFNTGGNTITSYRCTQLGAFWNTTTNNTAGNLLNAANPAPGQPILKQTYGYDPSSENPLIEIQTPTITTSTVTTPPDSTYTVTQVVAGTGSGVLYWFPRLITGNTYTVTVDIYATTGVTVQFGWNPENGSANTSVTTSTTGSYQNLSITFTATSTGALYFDVPASTGGFPATFYVANLQVAGIPAGWTATGSGTTMAYTTAQAHSGQYSLSLTASSSAGTAALPVLTLPGFTYTASAYVYAPAGTTGTLTVGASSTSTTVTGSWQRLVLSFTATDAVTLLSWSIPTAGSYPATIYLDDYQMEFGPAASTAVTTGPTFLPIYTGYVERFPTQWDMQGTLGIRPLTGVDALSILSRTEITQTYQATILADNPGVYIPYSDNALPLTVTLPAGGQPTVGYTSLGNSSGSVSFGGDTFLDGTQCVSLTQQNASPTVSGDPTYTTYLGTQNGSFAMNPQAVTLEFWMKFTSGVAYLGAGSIQPGENVAVEPFGPQHYLGIYTSAGRIISHYTDPNGGAGNAYGFPGFPGFPDGLWHYFAIVLLGGNDITLVCDGAIGGVGTLGFTPSQSIAVTNFFADVTTYAGDPVSGVSLANLAAYPYALSSTQLAAHYDRGAGYVAELSGTRVSRLLTQYWQGQQNVSSGHILMAEDYTYNTRFMLDVLQEIQETERGLVYATTGGAVRFEGSQSRYLAGQTALWVLGENPAGASPVEYPYTDLNRDFDPTYTFSQTNLTRPDNANFAPLPTPLPTNPPMGQRVLTQQAQVTTDYDLTQLSVFYLERYANPVTRIAKLSLNPAANPALWSVVLSLELSQRITVRRRTSAGFTTSADYYIEQINHSIDIEKSSWTVELQCSPVFVPTAWILGDPVYGVLGSTTVPVF